MKVSPILAFALCIGAAQAATPSVSSAQNGFSSTLASQFRRANVNKLVFFKRKPVEGREYQAPVATRFKAGESIYALAFLKGTHDSTGVNTHFYRLEMRADNSPSGKYAAIVESRATGGTPSSRTLIVDVAPDPSRVNDPKIAAATTACLSRLAPGVHRVRVTVNLLTSLDQPRIGDGTFIYDNRGGNAALAKKSRAMNTRAVANNRMPRAAMRNASLERQILAAAKRQDPRSQPLRAVIQDSGWTPYRNELGIIEYRAITATVASRYADGTINAQELSFSQDYLGGGRYSSRVELKGVGLKSFDLAPANVYK